MKSFFFRIITRRFFIWEVDRTTEFSPLKNGPEAERDCPRTCRKSILDMHASWARAVGAVFSNDARDIIEISPLVSLRGENLECLKAKQINGVNILELRRNEKGEEVPILVEVG
ncbi:unnamed protein product [Taenia asiatica]|uniref:Uncharacterized protein n=1 Tax=Taenia asiatica TaxID=60517 RepID=A0A0R3WH21_TAEAS|nr:unnamed protein product [Taenia asiatica]